MSKKAPIRRIFRGISAEDLNSPKYRVLKENGINPEDTVGQIEFLDLSDDDYDKYVNAEGDYQYLKLKRAKNNADAASSVSEYTGERYDDDINYSDTYDGHNTGWKPLTEDEIVELNKIYDKSENPFVGMKMRSFGHPQNKNEERDANKFNRDDDYNAKYRRRRAVAILRGWSPKGLYDVIDVKPQETTEEDKYIQRNAMLSPYSLGPAAAYDAWQEHKRDYDEFMAFKEGRLSESEERKLKDTYGKYSRPFNEFSKRLQAAGAEVTYDRYNRPVFDWDLTVRSGKDPIRLIRAAYPKHELIQRNAPAAGGKSDYWEEFSQIDTTNLTDDEYKQLVPHIGDLYDHKIIGVNVGDLATRGNKDRYRWKEIRNGEFSVDNPYPSISDYTPNDSYSERDEKASRGFQFVRGAAEGLENLANLGKLAAYGASRLFVGKDKAAQLIYDTPDWLQKSRLTNELDLKKRFNEKDVEAYQEALKNTNDLSLGNIKKILGSYVGDKEVDDYLRESSENTSLTHFIDTMAVDKGYNLPLPQEGDKKSEFVHTAGEFAPLAFATGPLSGPKAISKVGKELAVLGGNAAGMTYASTNRVPEELEAKHLDLRKDPSLGTFISDIFYGVLGGGLTGAGLDKIGTVAKEITGGVGLNKYKAAYNNLKRNTMTEAFTKANKESSEKYIKEVAKNNPDVIKALKEVFPETDLVAVSPERSVAERFIKKLDINDLNMNELPKDQKAVINSNFASEYQNLKANDNLANIREVVGYSKEPKETTIAIPKSAEAENWINQTKAKADTADLAKVLNENLETAEKHSNAATTGELAPELSDAENIVNASKEVQKANREQVKKNWGEVVNDDLLNTRFELPNAYAAAQDVLNSKIELWPETKNALEKFMKTKTEHDGYDAGFVKEFPQLVGKVKPTGEQGLPLNNIIDIRHQLNDHIDYFLNKKGDRVAAERLMKLKNAIDNDIKAVAESDSPLAEKAQAYIGANDRYAREINPVNAREETLRDIIGSDKYPTKDTYFKNIMKLDSEQKARLLSGLDNQQQWTLRKYWIQDLLNRVNKGDTLKDVSNKELWNIFADRASDVRKAIMDTNAITDLSDIFNNKSKYSIEGLGNLLNFAFNNNAPKSVVDGIAGALRKNLNQAGQTKLDALVKFNAEEAPLMFQGKVYSNLLNKGISGTAKDLKTVDDLKEFGLLVNRVKGDNAQAIFDAVKQEKKKMWLEELHNNNVIKSGEREGSYNYQSLVRDMEEKIQLAKHLGDQKYVDVLQGTKDFISKVTAKVEKRLAEEQGRLESVIQKNKNGGLVLSQHGLRNIVGGGILFGSIFSSLLGAITDHSLGTVARTAGGYGLYMGYSSLKNFIGKLKYAKAKQDLKNLYSDYESALQVLQEGNHVADKLFSIWDGAKGIGRKSGAALKTAGTQIESVLLSRKPGEKIGEIIDKQPKDYYNLFNVADTRRNENSNK